MHRLVLATVLAAAAFGPARAEEPATAIFAGGCFWCVESDFDKIEGVLETISGYIGGDVADPSYQQVVAGGTGHREAVEIRFDPEMVGYEALLAAFWRSVDPTDGGGQFCDRGFSYTTAIYAVGPTQRAAAETSKAAAEAALGQTIATPIEDAGPFYAAESYHQNYYEKNPARYRFYRWSCGRNAAVRDLWGDAAYAGIPGVD